jgi:CDP-paratose 2-epimerase
MKEKWLITGGCGFAGSNLAASLLDDGIDVTVFDNLSRAGSALNLRWLQSRSELESAGNLTFLHGDVRNEADVCETFERQAKSLTAVAHLAGQVAMTTSVAKPRLDFEVNALGSFNVLEAIRKTCANVPVIFSSTNKVYGDLEHLRYEEMETRWATPDFPAGFDETLPLKFSTPYGCSKGAADQYALDYARMFGLRTVVFRHSSIYGGHQFATYDQGWVGWFCQQVLRQKAERDAGREIVPFTISGDGKQVRDLAHADDIVRCYRMAARSTATLAATGYGQAYNIGGGPSNSLSLIELFAELHALTGVVPRFTKLERRQGDQRVFVADVRKATGVFGFSPLIDTREGLRRMVEWVASMGAWT